MAHHRKRARNPYAARGPLSVPARLCAAFVVDLLAKQLTIDKVIATALSRISIDAIVFWSYQAIKRKPARTYGESFGISGDHAGSEASVVVIISRSLRPVMSILNNRTRLP